MAFLLVQVFLLILINTADQDNSGIKECFLVLFISMRG